MSSAVHIVGDPASAGSMLHPLRLRVLAALDRPDSATGVARRLGLPRQQVNYHLRELEADGLVRAVGERQRRGLTERLVQAVARSYVISPGVVGDLAAEPSKVSDRMSSAYLVAVAAQMIHDLAALREAASRAGKRLPTLTLESEVRFAGPDAQRAFAQELTEAVAGLVAKYHDARAPRGRSFRVVAGAYPASPRARGAAPGAVTTSDTRSEEEP
ncbi:MAG TPA: helix-turn-helix domain-containing protein [Gemmatimonadaceae bacterium]|nr:helix-turn-helix domain-containing protein [Gemmatimonadaceae bacterium]